MKSSSQPAFAESAMSFREAIDIASTVLQRTPLGDVVRTLRSAKVAPERRAAAYSRSNAAHRCSEENLFAAFAEENKLRVRTYFFDRAGSSDGLTEVVARRSEYDVLLLEARDRDALEKGDLLKQLSEYIDVIWIPDVGPDASRST